MVPEAYLRGLEAGRGGRRRPTSSSPSNSHLTEEEEASNYVDGQRPRRSSQHTIENSAAELFVAKVKQLRQDAPFLAPSDPSLGDSSDPDGGMRTGAVSASGYEYFRLDYDTARESTFSSCPNGSLTTL